MPIAAGIGDAEERCERAIQPNRRPGMIGCSMPRHLGDAGFDGLAGHDVSALFRSWCRPAQGSATGHRRWIFCAVLACSCPEVHDVTARTCTLCWIAKVEEISPMAEMQQSCYALLLTDRPAPDDFALETATAARAEREGQFPGCSCLVLGRSW